MHREGENLDNFRGHSSRVHPQYSKVLSREEHICRICMDYESKDNPLITPCKCSGSVKYIHEECLKTWLISQDIDIDKGQCELCKTLFLMEFKIGRRCSIKESLSNGYSHFIYLPVLTCVMIMLFLVIYLLAEKYININQQQNEQGYTIALMITCGICGFVLFLLILNTVKEVCFIPCLNEWHIFSQRFSQDSPSGEMRDDTLVNDYSAGNFMIIPEKISVKGVKVSVPDLNPNLFQLNQRGRVVAYASRAATPNDEASFSVSHRLNSEPSRVYYQ